MSKEMLKNDIKNMLCQLISIIECNNLNYNSNYNSIVSKIYSELDTVTPIDLFVTREYLHDALSSSLSTTNVDTKVSKKKVSLTSANLKVVPDSVGNYFVIKNENGQDKIIFQTNDKKKADEYVKTNSMNPAIATPLEENLDQELTDIPSDDIPNTDVEASDTDSKELENQSIENSENLNIEKMDTIIQKGNDLISIIENSIDVIPDLNAITELVTIKVTLQDKIDAISVTDPSDPKLDQMLSNLTNILDQAESQAIDIINKNTPGAKIDELIPAKEIKEKIEDGKPTVESIIIEDEKFEDEVDEESEDKEFEIEDEIDKDSEDKESEIEDEEFEDFEGFEEFEDGEMEDEEMGESNLESLIDELVSIAEESGADPEELDEIRKYIYQEIDNLNSDTEKDFDGELDEFEEIAEDEELTEDEEIASHNHDEFDEESINESISEETTVSPDDSEVPSDEEVEQVDGQIKESVKLSSQQTKTKMDPFDFKTLEEE